MRTPPTHPAIHPALHPAGTPPRRDRFTPGAVKAVLLCLCALLGGCSGQESRCSSLDLGSVSIGDQLIDLSRAHKAGAISREQYRDAKAELLLLMKNAARFASDTPSSYSADQDSSSDATAETDNESEQEKSGFLF